MRIAISWIAFEPMKFAATYTKPKNHIGDKRPLRITLARIAATTQKHNSITREQLTR